MALNKDYKHQYRILIMDEDENNPVAVVRSDAHFREFYALHSVHVKITGVATATIQLSNIESPVENTDVDWVDYAAPAASAMIPINQQFRWIRIKRDASAGKVTVVLLSGSRSNT